jgi:hypothetical protein
MSDSGLTRPDLCSIRAAAEQAEFAGPARGLLSADGYPPAGDDPLAPLARDVARTPVSSRKSCGGAGRKVAAGCDTASVMGDSGVVRVIAVLALWVCGQGNLYGSLGWVPTRGWLVANFVDPYSSIPLAGDPGGPERVLGA